MKRLFVFAFVLWMGLGSALSVNATENKALPMEKLAQQELLFALDMGDLINKSDATISSEISSFLDAALTGVEAELNCKVSVKGKVSIGVATVEITVEVNGPCSEIKSQGTQIANQVLSEVKMALQRK